MDQESLIKLRNSCDFLAKLSSLCEYYEPKMNPTQMMTALSEYIGMMGPLCDLTQQDCEKICLDGIDRGYNYLDYYTRNKNE